MQNIYFYTYNFNQNQINFNQYIIKTIVHNLYILAQSEEQTDGTKSACLNASQDSLNVFS